MAQLNPKPGSSTKRQRYRLHQLKRDLGFTDDELHVIIGAASTTHLSAAQASEWITHFTGRGLPNPPGQKPSSYKGKRATPGVTRMITDDQVDQIVRLGVEYFGEVHLLISWLVKDFKLPAVEARGARGHRAVVRHLGTARRAGEVVRVLKLMIARRNKKDVAPASGRCLSRDREGADNE